MADSISQALREIIDAGHTTPAEIARATGRDPSTVSRWLADETAPLLPNFLALIRSVNIQARRRLLHVVVDGMPLDICERPDGINLDLNRDGRVDAVDALAAAIGANGSLAELLGQINTAAVDGSLSQAQRSAALAGLEHLESQVRQAQAIISESPVRQQARRTA